MTPASSEQSPFGPNTQKYWDRRHQYFDRFDQGIETDAEGLYSVVPQEVGFAGIGGNAIAFARSGKHVIAIDSSVDRLAMARHNADVYDVASQIEFIHGDFLDLVGNFRNARAVYLDPPWGGPDYKHQGVFRLSSFDPDGHRLLALTLPLFDEVLLRVPRTFDTSELEDYNRRWRVLDDISAGRVVSRSVLFAA
jgi:trimethylguanosine synthase